MLFLDFILQHFSIVLFTLIIVSLGHMTFHESKLPLSELNFVYKTNQLVAVKSMNFGTHYNSLFYDRVLRRKLRQNLSDFYLHWVPLSGADGSRFSPPVMGFSKFHVC